MRASSSPSMGWYLDSAGVQNLDPQVISCHPVLQQEGCMFLQEHLFCHNANPTPVVLQSDTMQVHESRVND